MWWSGSAYRWYQQSFGHWTITRWLSDKKRWITYRFIYLIRQSGLVCCCATIIKTILMVNVIRSEI